MSITVKTIDYKGLENCVEISNGIVDLVVTASVGPRIIRYGFIGEKNQFAEIEEDFKRDGIDKYKFYGGHRLWHSPEHIKRTYVPDNKPVKWFQDGDNVVFEQDVEEWTDLRKTISIKLSKSDSKVIVNHTIKNMGAWPIKLAAWGISIMAAGGTAYIPMNNQDTGLLPNRVLSVWAYTDLSDDRLVFNKKDIMIRQDKDFKDALKIGTNNTSGLLLYLNGDTTYGKKFLYENNVEYPDNGVNCECYTNENYLELEALSGLSVLNYDDEVELYEEWYLYKDSELKNDSNEIKERICKIKNIP